MIRKDLERGVRDSGKGRDKYPPFLVREKDRLRESGGEAKKREGQTPGAGNRDSKRERNSKLGRGSPFHLPHPGASLHHYFSSGWPQTFVRSPCFYLSSVNPLFLSQCRSDGISYSNLLHSFSLFLTWRLHHTARAHPIWPFLLLKAQILSLLPFLLAFHYSDHPKALPTTGPLH